LRHLARSDESTIRTGGRFGNRVDFCLQRVAHHGAPSRVLASNMHRGLRIATVMLLFGCATAPPTITERAVDADAHLWLEEAEGESALAWARQQNARTLGELQADPRYARFEAEARRILEARDRIADPVLMGGVVYNFWQDDVHVRGLLRRADWSSYASGAPNWETVLDVDALALQDGKPWVTGLPDCLPPDYRRCLVSLSNGGKDAREVREFDLETRQFVADGFVLPEAKHAIEWIDRDRLLVATDWGEGTLTASGYPFVVKRWARGQPLREAAEVFRGSPQDVGTFPLVLRDRNGSAAVVVVRAESFFESTFHLVAGEQLLQLPLPRRAELGGYWDGQLVASLQEDWTVDDETFPSGSVVSFPLAAFVRTGKPEVATVYAPGPRESFQQFKASRSAAYLLIAENVVTRAYRLAYRGGRWHRIDALDLPAGSQVSLGSIHADDDRAFAYAEGFLNPRSLYVIDGLQPPRMLAELPARFDAGSHVVEQLEAASKDGTRVPYFVVRPRGLQPDGSAPTLLYGYGGFQISMTPSYSGTLGKLWLEDGGVYVLANIRGGGEFGPAWHQAGLKTKRQVVFDDFIAIAEDLIARGITSPRRLGIAGGSNGGLLMGVALTQRPELWNAVVVQVPLLDMLRFDRMLAGASWVDEYGSPAAPEERAFLARISPYHNLRAGTRYPPPFFVTSTKDDRVHPGHARKMAARMADLGLPFYYYENIDGGHAAAADQRERAKRVALEFTYLVRRLKD
jgi:prolyl oligopeptidase